jgi:hypothetical protein
MRKSARDAKDWEDLEKDLVVVSVAAERRMAMEKLHAKGQAHSNRMLDLLF